jgi:hypothetical protein
MGIYTAQPTWCGPSKFEWECFACGAINEKDEPCWFCNSEENQERNEDSGEVSC